MTSASSPLAVTMMIGAGLNLRIERANLDPIFAGEHQIEKNQMRAISSGDEYSIIAIGSRDRR